MSANERIVGTSWGTMSLSARCYYCCCCSCSNDLVLLVYLCVSVPADCSSVPHLPVFDKLCPRAKSGPVREVLVQKCSHHGGDHQGTWTLGTPAQKHSLSHHGTFPILPAHAGVLCLKFHHSHLLRAVVLGGPRLQENGGGASLSVGGAPLYAPPLHPQLLPDLFDFGLQQAFLCFQPLLLSLAETAVPSPVEPGGSIRENGMEIKH